MIGWQFPETGWGIETGIHDSGIETFKGNPFPSLARETLQNSSDAKREGIDEPVKVVFELFKISSSEFPGRDEFIKILQACKNDPANNEETNKFFEKALEVINENEITFLRVSDFNTTGLTGSDQLRGTKWHHLIKSVGVSNKGSTSGGSFGIGKHAAFVCSQLRTVFYGTCDEEGKRAFQGVSKLITHLDNEGNPRQGTGFYGEKEYLQPLKDFSKISSCFQRSETGTDIFIAGFKETENWEDEINKSVLENFFVAIHEGKLEVVVGKKQIKADNLPLFIEKYIKDDTEYNAEKYYEALTSNESKCFKVDNFEGLGEVQLFLLNKNNFHKKIAMVRSTGMLIKAKQNYSVPVKYAGVLLIKGTEFNKFLRSIENPSHTDWEVKRHDDEKYAKRILNKLNRWINEKIKELTSVNDTEVYNVEELGQFLPDDIDMFELLNNSSQVEGEKGKTREIKLDLVKRRNNSLKEVFSGLEEAGAASEDVQESGDEADDSYHDDNIPGSEEPGNGGLSNRGRGAGNGGSGNGNSGNGGSSNEWPGNENGKRTVSNRKARKRIRIERFFCTNSNEGIYEVRLAAENVGKVFLSVNVSGEEDSEPAQIESAINKSTGDTISVNGCKVGPITLAEGQRNSIEFKLKHAMRCALEVSIDEG
jgi:uncharacterized membrane protein YgcG